MSSNENENREGLLLDPQGQASSSQAGSSETTDSSALEEQDRSRIASGRENFPEEESQEVSQRTETTEAQPAEETTVVRPEEQGDYVVADTDQSESARQAQTRTADTGDTIEVPRYEEELAASKRSQETGEVRVSKDVVEEQQTLEVPVTREEVHVRSRPVDESNVDTSEAFQGGTIEVPVREEAVDVQKQARVAEELDIEKRAVQETESVSDTVRKERVNVEEVGDVEVDPHSGDPYDRDVRARE